MDVDAREALFAAQLESTRREMIIGRLGEAVTAVCKVKIRYLALGVGAIVTAYSGFNFGKALGEQNNPPQTKTLPETSATTVVDSCVPASLPEDPADLMIDIERCHQIEQNHGDDLVPLLDAKPQN